MLPSCHEFTLVKLWLGAGCKKECGSTLKDFGKSFIFPNQVTTPLDLSMAGQTTQHAELPPAVKEHCLYSTSNTQG